MTMNDYLLLMHNDATAVQPDEMWETYFASLRAGGTFDGGSAVGGGLSHRKAGQPAPLSRHLQGFMRVRAESLTDAAQFLEGNPVYECGGTVEIRELPRD